MSKKTRGATRPGQRRPVQKAATRPAPSPAVRRADGLSAEEEARAAELEAQVVAQERAAAQSRARTRERVRIDDEDRSARRASGQSLLEVKAQAEYAYVVRDVRRIVITASGLGAIMAVLYVILEVAHLVSVG